VNDLLEDGTAIAPTSAVVLNEISIMKVEHPRMNTGACEAIRLAIGEPTRVTAKLAYPSSEMGG
jgi:hypothetical protein